MAVVCVVWPEIEFVHCPRTLTNIVTPQVLPSSGLDAENAICYLFFV